MVWNLIRIEDYGYKNLKDNFLGGGNGKWIGFKEKKSLKYLRN